MKKKEQTNENYLEKIPQKNSSVKWSKDEKDLVTLEIENRGVMNKIAQKLFKKPKFSYIHLDENGSLVWESIDGELNLIQIGEKVHEHFGDKAEPLYERLAKFVSILNSYSFIDFK